MAALGPNAGMARVVATCHCQLSTLGRATLAFRGYLLGVEEQHARTAHTHARGPRLPVSLLRGLAGTLSENMRPSVIAPSCGRIATLHGHATSSAGGHHGPRR